ncbi:MAG: bifunctional metallophosphatase/5'-nucleotidase [Candidatus Bathyarchaeota archaeon]|nr:bifunctional metallophosphatase/5'-nucleotidase [Candidatus Bathyarchaeota archaeon]
MSPGGLTILQINDLHGYMEPHQEIFWSGDHPEFRETGGLARIATLVAEARVRNPDGVILLDNGDTIHGTYPVVSDRGASLKPILNKLGFDAWTAHWDFAYGPEYLKQYAGELDYPLLAINCYDKETGELVFKPYRILTRNNVRVAIMGVAATIVDKVMPESFHTGVRFTIGEEELRHWVKHVREKENAELVIVLSHLGYPQELKLLKGVDGIDVLLSGHTHNRIRSAVKVNGALIIQSGCHGSFLGRIDLDVESQGVKQYRHRLIEVDETIPPDKAIRKLVETAVKPHRKMLSAVIGETRTNLYRNNVLESTMDNLLLQAIQSYTGTELAFSNGWRYGAPVPVGPITMRDVWNIIPVNPPISLCSLTGKEVWDMMEQNLEQTFASDPYDQMGGFVKRCLGLNLYFKIENPTGKRITKLFIDGKPVDLNRKYTACYLTEQGVRAGYGSDKRVLDINAVDVLTNYIKDHRVVESPLRNTVNAV